ncbi:MAG: HU family DNA-binding protein [Bacteroidaceae bacterium]|nr:HU family DNA-binding protein [Bacteroidaceae bacterium]
MIKYNLMEGKNPRTEEPMFYAMAAPVTTIKLEGLAEEISQECTVTAHDIRAVISAMEEKIITHLQNGQSIRLGLLGSFCPTIRSRSSRTPEGFNNGNITGIGATFRPSSTMKYKLSADNPAVQFQRAA